MITSNIKPWKLLINGANSSLQGSEQHTQENSHQHSNTEIWSIDNRTKIHWRKRSGIGLCAVAYVISPGPGRGETVYLSNFRRMASGKGNAKFREKLIEVLEISYRFETSAVEGPINVIEKIVATADLLMESEQFDLFLKSGHKKADHYAAIDYLRRSRPS
jgi:hypothetical protein